MDPSQNYSVNRDRICTNCQASLDDEPTRVVTVRMPKSLHTRLKEDAHAEQTSLNKLCLARLAGEDATEEQEPKPPIGFHHVPARPVEPEIVVFREGTVPQ